MDTTVLTALIGAAGTLLGALLGRSDLFDKIARGSKLPPIRGRWKSSWLEGETDQKQERREWFVITRQKGTAVSGHIVMDNEPDKKWDLEGDFNGRFLRLFWHPSKDAENKLFLDYGCYFFEMKSDGRFEGYAVGHDWGSSKTEVVQHWLARA